MSLEKLRDRLQKAVKGVHVQRMTDSDIASVKEWFPTPAYDLNRILSGSLFKGVPSRNFTLIVGPEASFKSSFMCLCAVEAQKRGYTPIVIDTEGAWTSDFVKRWGLDPDNVLFIYTPWVDELQVTLGSLISDKEQKLCIILDSIGGLEKLKLISDAEKGDVKADQGRLQKEIKVALKMVLNICKGQDSIVLASGHYYGNPNSYGNADEIGGGKFVKLAPDTIISLKKTKILDNSKKVIGNNITAITLKNRFYPPFHEATVEIDYHKGINCIAGLVPIAVDAGLVQVGGSWYTLPDGSKVQGIEKVKEELKKDKEKFKSFLNAIEEFISKTGYSTKNEAVEEAMKVMEEPIAEEKPAKKKTRSKK